METIWKFPLKVEDRVMIAMPKGAQILCVQVQYGIPCIWAAVEDNGVWEERHFYISGTGHPIEYDTSYVGTFQLCDGSFIGHVFEERG